MRAIPGAQLLPMDPSMIVFDSTLWHAAGANRSGKDRLAINQQFTRSYVKQQVDYVRALGLELQTLALQRLQLRLKARQELLAA